MSLQQIINDGYDQFIISLKEEKQQVELEIAENILEFVELN